MAQVQLAWSSSAPTEQVYPRGAPNAGVHFNARGELIPYAVVPAVASLGPPDAMTDSPETDDDDDMGLELAYPDDDQLLEARPPPLSASPLVVPYISRTQPITTPTLIYSAALPYTPYPAPPAALPPSQTQTRSRPITTPTPTPPTMYTLPYTAPYTPPYTAPSAAPRPQPPQTQPQPRKRIPLPRRTPRKSAPGACAGADAAAGPSTNMVAAAAAALRQSGPRLPVSVVAYAPMAPGIPIPIYTHAPPPMVTQVIAPPPVSAPAPADAPCVMGCGGRAPAKGRRCLSCVRGSWAGRGRAAEEARVKAGAEAVDKQRREKEGTPKKEREGRVTIKLRVTPKAAGRVVVVEPKGKGKAVDPEEKKGKSESVDPKAIEMDAPLPLVGTPAPPSTPKPKDSSPENKTVDAFESKPVEGTSTNNTPKGSSVNDADAALDAAMWDGAGWDSELTDLSDSAGEEPPRPSFKIRIPARTPTKHSPSPASTSTPTKRAGDPTATPTTPGLSTSLPTPPASAEVQRFCTIARCRVPLPPHSLYRWKCCSSCRKQYREYARDRLARVAAANAATPSDGTAPTPAPKAKPPTPTGPKTLPAHIEALRAHTAQKEWQREENRRALALAGVPVKARREPPPPPPPPPPVTWSVAPGVQQKRAQRQVPGARVCAGRTCDHIIPAEDEYEWTMCGVCHAREQRKAERMDGKSPTKGKGAEKDDMPIAAVRKPGRCRYADCGTLMPVDAEVSVAECEQCVRRKLQRKTPGRPLGSRNKPKGSATAGPLATRKPQTAASPEKPLEAPRKRKRVSPYPSYQCRDALLADFGTRFHGFIEAQSYYFLMRGGMAHTQPPAQAMFDFSGEYSVIAADLDIVGRKGTVEVGVHGVKDAVARAGGLEFSPTSWVSILGNPGGIVTRFACVHLVTMFLPIRVPPGHPPNPALPKTMQGELEIAVLPDESHKYFAGEKTIVRFRLVG